MDGLVGMSVGRSDHGLIWRGMTAEEPFTLLRLKDGDLILTDRLTGRRMLLNAFGPSNERVFAELLDHGRMTQ